MLGATGGGRMSAEEESSLHAWKIEQARRRAAESKLERQAEQLLQWRCDVFDRFIEDGTSVRVLARDYGTGWGAVEDCIRAEIRSLWVELGYMSPDEAEEYGQADA